MAVRRWAEQPLKPLAPPTPALNHAPELPVPEDLAAGIEELWNLFESIPAGNGEFFVGRTGTEGVLTAYKRRDTIDP